VSKICVVTGANSGIGFEASRQLAERGATVVMVCRNPERGEAARALVGDESHLFIADMGDLDAVRALAAEIVERFEAVDVLINNAAVFDLAVDEPVFTAQGHEKVWAVNHLGPFLLTHLLRDQLAAVNGRLITISSQGLVAKPRLTLDFDDLDSRGDFDTTKAYYRSKLAQCSFAISVRERNLGVVSNGVRVTSVAVPDDRLPELGSFQLWAYKRKRRFAITPAEMAETYVWLALDASIDGEYVDHKRKSVSWPKRVRDRDLRDRLWDVTMQHVGES
jgi:NAD(P)-dependent dehydrogenase (short-subunit alcohol dehydrogenase family)